MDWLLLIFLTFLKPYPLITAREGSVVFEATPCHINSRSELSAIATASHLRPLGGDFLSTRQRTHNWLIPPHSHAPIHLKMPREFCERNQGACGQRPSLLKPPGCCHHVGNAVFHPRCIHYVGVALVFEASIDWCLTSPFYHAVQPSLHPHGEEDLS